MDNHSVIEIPLSRGYIAFVDEIDKDLSELDWYATSDKGRGKYAIRNSGYDANGKRETIQMHKVIMARMLGRDLLSNERVDHIDGNGFNNCRSNLRIADQRQNCQNRKIRKDNQTGYKGVCFHKTLKSKPYQAIIQVDNKRISLGYFKTAIEAHKAYCDAATKHFGEFARFE